MMRIYVVSTVFHLLQDDAWLIMKGCVIVKGCVQWRPVNDLKDIPSKEELEPGTASSVGQRLA